MAFGLYLHYPFVRHPSAYGVTSTLTHTRSLEQRFYSALQLETEQIADSIRDHAHHIDSIYVGGGDAALTDLALFEDWYQLVTGLFMVTKPCEFSFAVEPASGGLDLMEKLEKIGVNRPVFNVRTFDVELLNLLGGRHTLHQVHESIYYANALGFDNFGCKLLYGLPGQTGRRLSPDLDQITDLAPPHLSFRRLHLLPGSEMDDKIKSGDIRRPAAEFVQTLKQAGHEHLTEHGYEEYTAGSFARPGHECRYDLDRSNGGEFVGLGPSAGSFVDGKRYSNVPDLDTYLDALERGHRPVVL